MGSYRLVILSFRLEGISLHEYSLCSVENEDIEKRTGKTGSIQCNLAFIPKLQSILRPIDLHDLEDCRSCGRAAACG